jgi:hypothetical protein
MSRNPLLEAIHEARYDLESGWLLVNGCRLMGGAESGGRRAEVSGLISDQ